MKLGFFQPLCVLVKSRGVQAYTEHRLGATLRRKQQPSVPDTAPPPGALPHDVGAQTLGDRVACFHLN